MGDPDKSRGWIKPVVVGVTVTVIGGVLLAQLLRPKPTVRSFAAEPPAAVAGEEVRLSWEVADAKEVTIDQGVGRVPPQGTHKVTLTEPTAFALSATNEAGTKTLTIEVPVDRTPVFERSTLRLRDIFRGDSGWERTPLNPDYARVFKTDVGSGRFRMELLENRSATTAYRAVTIAPDEDFLIEVEVNATEPTNYSYGLAWALSGGAEHFFYVSPSSQTYLATSMETWTETLPDGGKLGHAGSRNLLDVNDVNRRFQSPHIKQGTAPNKLTVIRDDEKLKLYINDTFVNQASYESTRVIKAGFFISGTTKAEFRDFNVRARTP